MPTMCQEDKSLLRSEVRRQALKFKIHLSRNKTNSRGRASGRVNEAFNMETFSGSIGRAPTGNLTNTALIGSVRASLADSEDTSSAESISSSTSMASTASDASCDTPDLDTSRDTNQSDHLLRLNGKATEVCDCTSRRTRNDIGELLLCGFYHNTVGRGGAEKLLKDQPEGSFLLRDSSDSHALLAVSINTPYGVTSIRVSGEPGRYQLDCHRSATPLPTCKTPLQLIAFLSLLSNSSCASRFSWLDGTGRKHSSIKLKFPLYSQTPTPNALLRWSEALEQAEQTLSTAESLLE